MKIFGKIFATISSILFTFILFALLMFSFSLNLTSGSYYASVLKSANLKTIKVADIKEQFDVKNLNLDLDENASIEDALVAYFTESGVDKDIALAVINNDKVREVFGEFIGEFMNYSVSGEKPNIAREDVESVFNEKAVKDLIASSPEKIEVDIDKIYNQLNDLAENITKDGGANKYGITNRNNEVNISNKQW